MNPKIKYFQDIGDLSKERLVLVVEREDDIGNYLIFRTDSAGDDSVSSSVKATFWFPNKPVKAGDFIVLYTKSGKQSEKTASSGITSHFFYWGFPTAIWSEGEAAVILRTSEWSFSAVSGNNRKS